MKILMLSWEYPPKNIGGLSNHVHNLSKALTLLGHEIHVVTCEEGVSPVEENDEGIIVHRVTPYKIDTEDFTKWIMHLNFSMIEECIRIIRKIGKVDIIHAHDWLSAYSAKALKWAFSIPMVSTIHATEEGRNNGIRTDMQKYISSAEWLLAYESWKVICCSDYMKSEIINSFKVLEDKIWVIPNGVDLNGFNFKFDNVEFRRNYALDEEKIVFFIGRHVFEKGIQLLVDAAPKIIAQYGRAKFVIAGTGPMTEELKYKVKQMGLENKILFTGYMNNETKSKLYRVADVSVFPSLYEPFGIVAIESMISGCPVVVSDTGGLSELVEHGVNGMKMINGLADSLKDNVLALLKDDKLCESIKENAKKSVKEKYNWEEVAKLTTKMYSLVKEEAAGTDWDVDKRVFTETDLSSMKTRQKKRTTVKKEAAEDKSEEVKETKPRRRTKSVASSSDNTVKTIKLDDTETIKSKSTASKSTKRRTTRKTATKAKAAEKDLKISAENLDGTAEILANDAAEDKIKTTTTVKRRTRKTPVKADAVDKGIDNSDNKVETTKSTAKRTRRTKKVEDVNK